MRFISGLLITIIILSASYSCKRKGEKNINQGEIHYNIEYSGNVSSMKEVMPRNLIVSFKDNKILFEMTTFGNSGIINLTNPEKGIYDTYISLMTLRYFYVGKEGEIPPGFEAMNDMKIRKTDKTAVICGFNCKSAEITLPGQPDHPREVWYTNEIKIKDPNGGTPFKDIDGVLMNFFYILGTSEMTLTAENVFKKEISDNIFERRTKYIRLSREDIDKFISKFIAM